MLLYLPYSSVTCLALSCFRKGDTELSDQSDDTLVHSTQFAKESVPTQLVSHQDQEAFEDETYRVAEDGTVDAFTCPKKPQKSQIKSAHLKPGGSLFNVLARLHSGHLHD